jgi:pimeloyl-ACP methyl ester carboxylesterase
LPNDGSSVEQNRPQLEEAMKTVTSKDGTTIAYDDLGDGPPVILVIGAMCDRDTHAGLAERLSNDVRVINYDRRGRGDSDEGSPGSLEKEIEDLAALIEAVGGEASLYGISSGGALVLEAVAAGLPVTKAIVYEVRYSIDDNDLVKCRRYGEALTKTLAEGRNGDAVDLFMTLVGMPENMIAGMHHAPQWPAMEAIAPTLAYDAEAMGMSSRGGAVPEDRLASITIPTLVLSGGASWPGMVEAAQLIADALPNAEFKILERQGHDVSPDAIAPVLAGFFAQ